MQTATDELETKGKAARKAARLLAKLGTDVKNRALVNIADSLKSRQEEILAANDRDCEAGRKNGLSEALMDRLDFETDPDWLTGDVIGALSALTEQRFGYDLAAWRAWWQRERGADATSTPASQ